MTEYRTDVLIKFRVMFVLKINQLCVFSADLELPGCVRSPVSVGL